MRRVKLHAAYRHVQRRGRGVHSTLFPGLRKSTTPSLFLRKSRLIGERAFTWVEEMLMSLIFDPPPTHTHAQTLHYISLIGSKSVDMEIG